jgi:hypothetical protein
MAFAIFAVAATLVLAYLATRPQPRRIPVEVRDSRRRAGEVPPVSLRR